MDRGQASRSDESIAVQTKKTVVTVDDLSDFSKGQAFECFHGYKQAHISLCVYCAYVYSLFLLPFLFVVFFVCMYIFFSSSSFDYHFGE